MILHGDSLDVLKTFPEVHFDSVVCDPPYGLSFMGRAWDYDVPSVDLWREVFRVLKPGGHLLAFAGTRTQHRMACAIEDAGFEIRDMIAWLYGSGFPKSLDVSKAIDKAAGVEREVVRVPASAARNPKAVGSGKDMDVVGSARPWIEAAIANGFHEKPGDTPVTEAARQWRGWGTALKPAMEPITVARKPLIGTVAANVLAHGTGALNIDGCRVGTEDGYTENAVTQGVNGARTSFEPRRQQRTLEPSPLGRWPANVIHDGSDEATAGFPETGASTTYVRGQDNSRLCQVGRAPAGALHHGYHDPGSAARYFYTAKADAGDRLGSKHPTVKPVDLMAYLCRLVTPPGGLILDPFAGTGTTGQAAMREGFRFVLIEREAEYVEDIKRRLAHVKGEDTPLFGAA